MQATEAKRTRAQIYTDVLRAIHRTKRNGNPLHLYALEREARLTYPRLKECLDELRMEGLIDASMAVTERGYTFLQEFSTKVAPVMVKYGLWQDGL